MLFARRKQSGFTLIELLVALAIVGIIASLALPAYQSSVTKTRRADGKSKLSEIMQAQERYFTLNNTYTVTLGSGGLDYTTDGGYVVSDEKFYKITASACGSGINQCVLLTAEPQGAQTSDGNLTLNSINQRTGNW